MVGHRVMKYYTVLQIQPPTKKKQQQKHLLLPCVYLRHTLRQGAQRCLVVAVLLLFQLSGFLFLVGFSRLLFNFLFRVFRLYHNFRVNGLPKGTLFSDALLVALAIPEKFLNFPGSLSRSNVLLARWSRGPGRCLAIECGHWGELGRSGRFRCR